MVKFSHAPASAGVYLTQKLISMKLTAKKSTAETSHCIEVEHEGEPLATVFCDTSIKWLTSAELPVALVQEVVTIAMNFKLIYYNLI